MKKFILLISFFVLASGVSYAMEEGEHAEGMDAMDEEMMMEAPAPSVTLTGEAEIGFKNVDDDDKPNAETIQLVRAYKVTFGSQGTTDAGLVFGAGMSIRDDTGEEDAPVVKGSNVYIGAADGTWKLKFGGNDAGALLAGGIGVADDQIDTGGTEIGLEGTIGGTKYRLTLGDPQTDDGDWSFGVKHSLGDYSIGLGLNSDSGVVAGLTTSLAGFGTSLYYAQSEKELSMIDSYYTPAVDLDIKVTEGTAGTPTGVTVTEGTAGTPTGVTVTEGTAGTPEVIAKRGESYWKLPGFADVKVGRETWTAEDGRPDGDEDREPGSAWAEALAAATLNSNGPRFTEADGSILTTINIVTGQDAPVNGIIPAPTRGTVDLDGWNRNEEGEYFNEDIAINPTNEAIQAYNTYIAAYELGEDGRIGGVDGDADTPKSEDLIVVQAIQAEDAVPNVPTGVTVTEGTAGTPTGVTVTEGTAGTPTKVDIVTPVPEKRTALAGTTEYTGMGASVDIPGGEGTTFTIAYSSMKAETLSDPNEGTTYNADFVDENGKVHNVEVEPFGGGSVKTTLIKFGVTYDLGGDASLGVSIEQKSAEKMLISTERMDDGSYARIGKVDSNDITTLKASVAFTF